MDHNPNVRWPEANPNAKYECTRNEDNPIGQGAERIAYPSINNYTGKKFVTKVPVNDDDPILTNEAICKYVVKTYNTANRLCKAFAKEIPTADSIEFVNASYVQDMESLPNKKYFLHERYVHGNEFKKWNDNRGVINHKEQTSDVQAFAHFVWAYTKGNRMILDLQGIHKDDTDQYFLTDPAYISSTTAGGLCGPCDLGNIAMINFFKFHDVETCKKMKCAHLPRPDISKLPTDELGQMQGESLSSIKKPEKSSTQSLTLQQTYKNTARAILTNPKAIKNTLKVSSIMGMEDEHADFLKSQITAISLTAPSKVSIAALNALSSTIPSLVPNYKEGDDPKTTNPCGLKSSELKAIEEEWRLRR